MRGLTCRFGRCFCTPRALPSGAYGRGVHWTPAQDDSPSVTLDPCSRPSSEYAKLSRRGDKVSDVEDLNAKSTPAACRRGNTVSDAEEVGRKLGAQALRRLLVLSYYLSVCHVGFVVLFKKILCAA